MSDGSVSIEVAEMLPELRFNRLGTWLETHYRSDWVPSRLGVSSVVYTSSPSEYRKNLARFKYSERNTLYDVFLLRFTTSIR